MSSTFTVFSPEFLNFVNEFFQELKESRQQSNDLIKTLRQELKEARQQSNDLIETLRQELKESRQQSNDLIETLRQELKEYKQQKNAVQQFSEKSQLPETSITEHQKEAHPPDNSANNSTDTSDCTLSKESPFTGLSKEIEDQPSFDKLNPEEKELVETYNDNPTDLKNTRKILPVSPTSDSIGQSFAKPDAEFLFEQDSRGNYWLINDDSSNTNLYLVPKSDFNVHNDSALKVLRTHIFSCNQNSQDVAGKSIKIIKLAKVTKINFYDEKWKLTEKGEIKFT